MEITEIVLLVAGGIIFILSFLIPDKKGEVSEQSKELVKEEIAELVSREMESVRGQVDGVVEEAVTYAMEKTERSLERLSNEKIMAVNEYSDTVLSEIHKNHEEAMFLYDMLNSKHDNLKNTVSTVNRTVKEVEEKLSSFQEMAGVSGASQMRMTEEKTAGQGVVQPARLQEFQPVTSSDTAGFTAISRLQTMARQSSAAASSNGNTEVLNTGKNTGNTAAPVESVPQTSVPVESVPQASVPVASMPQPAPLPDMSTAGRVSFLQEKAADGQNNNERILELYRQGKSKVAIAKELGLGVGEVKLVIDLFRNQ